MTPTWAGPGLFKSLLILPLTTTFGMCKISLCVYVGRFSTDVFWLRSKVKLKEHKGHPLFFFGAENFFHVFSEPKGSLWCGFLNVFIQEKACLIPKGSPYAMFGTERFFKTSLKRPFDIASKILRSGRPQALTDQSQIF